ncbi:MAG: hypothetical protein Q8K58_16655 [Acidimicrobiales bacterium]|nr:hypothetical protein [Acidimicrobiales bacterium]
MSTDVPTRPTYAGRRRRARGWWVPWGLATLPAIAARVLVGLGLFNFEQLIAAVLATGALVAIAARPAPSLAVLCVLLPFQLMFTSGLYELGLAGGLTRMAALWKELVVLALVLAAWRRSSGRSGALDALDRLAVAFVILGTIYVLVPELLLSGAGPPLSVDARFVSWRIVVLPSVLFLACRRLHLQGDELRRVVRGATALAAAMGVVGVVEFVASGWWNSLLVNTVGVNRYRFEVLGVDFRSQGLSLVDIRVYGTVAGREIIRAGGPMVSHLTFSFVLLIGLGIVVERIIRQQVTVAVVVGAVGCGLGLLFTQTRSSIVGACVLVIIALRPAPGRRTTDRARYAIIAGAAIVVALPLVLGAGLGDRFTEGDEISDSVHDDRVDLAVETVIDHPFGLGLGMGSTAGGRAAEGAVPVENQILDTAVQLGVLGSALLVGQYFLLISSLRRSSAGADRLSQTLAFGTRNAMVGMLVALWYQQAFGLLEVSWILFALAGTALGAVEASRDRDPAQEPVRVPGR